MYLPSNKSLTVSAKHEQVFFFLDKLTWTSITNLQSTYANKLNASDYNKKHEIYYSTPQRGCSENVIGHQRNNSIFCFKFTKVKGTWENSE